MKSSKIYLLIIFICILIIATVVYVTYSKQNDYLIRGEKVYKKHCENCHGKNGEGLQLLIPPLTDTDWLSSDSLVCIIKNGMDGAIEVNGKLYSGRMPSNPAIENDEIADVISYIRMEFGNLNQRESIKSVDDKYLLCR